MARAQKGSLWEPSWDDVSTWTRKLVYKNKWRCDWLHSADDLIQDCYLIFMKICVSYPRVLDQTSFEKLYKRSCVNKFHDRSCHKDRRKNLFVPTDKDISEMYQFHTGELTNNGYLMAVLNEAPEELKLALKILNDAPEKYLELDKTHPKLSVDQKVRRILGIDTNFNFTNCLERLFTTENDVTTPDAVERELSAICKIKGSKYPDRQDYLAAVVRAVLKLTDAQYDGLTEEAVQWHDAAVDAIKEREQIPDFNGELEETEVEFEADAVDEAEATEASEESDAVPEEAVAPKAVKPKPAKEKKPKQPKPGEAPPPNTIKGVRPNYVEMTGEKNRFGITAGTKAALAMEMFEEGATAADVEEKIGGKFYNALRALVKEGHKMEKTGKTIKLTHKDDLKN